MLGILKAIFGGGNTTSPTPKNESSPPHRPITQPLSAEALCDQAWDLHTKGQNAAAQQMLVDGLQTIGEDSDIHFTLAKILAREDKARFALGANSQTVEQANEIVRRWRAAEYRTLFHAKRAYELTPNDPNYRFTYSQNWAAIGHALETIGEFDDAFEAFVTSQEIELPTHESQAELDKHVLFLMHTLLKQTDANGGSVDPARATLYRARAEHARKTEKVYAFQCEQLAAKLDPTRENA